MRRFTYLIFLCGLPPLGAATDPPVDAYAASVDDPASTMPRYETAVDEPFADRAVPAKFRPDPEPVQTAAKAVPQVSVHFSPSDECEAEIVGQVDRAKSSIRVLAYSFTSAPIAAALTQAAARGVDVRVILDRLQSAGRGSQMATLQSARVPVLIDGKHPIMHDKVIAVDGERVMAGSYNFSVQAHRNAENLLTVESPAITRRYLDDWESHAAHAVPPPKQEVPKVKAVAPPPASKVVPTPRVYPSSQSPHISLRIPIDCQRVVR